MRIKIIIAALLAAYLTLSSSAWSQDFKVLVFSKTTGFRHVSIPDGISAINTLGANNNFLVDATEDSSVFNTANLAQYDAVIFLQTSELPGLPLLTASEQAAFEDYIKGGGGFVGVHAACDVSGEWPWFDGLVGANFLSHPKKPSRADLFKGVQGPGSVSELFDSLASNYTQVNDEWYNFEGNPLEVEGLTPIIFADEDSYDHGTFQPDRHDVRFGAEHPLSWYQGYGPYWFSTYGKGRSFYTAIGDRPQLYFQGQFSWFREHLLRGIRYAVGQYTPPLIAIPGRVEAEDFDDGGNADVGNTDFRITYKDLTAGNTGLAYRTTDVDISEFATGEYAVGWNLAGEWLEFTLDVTQSGNYTGVLRVASGQSTNKTLSISGVDPTDFESMIDLTGPITYNTGGAGWTSFIDVALPPIALTEGVHTLRLNFETAGQDIDYIEFVLAPGATEIQFDDFETGFGNWIDGGNDCLRNTSGSFVNGTAGVINLQDNTNSSTLTTADLALSAYNDVIVEFDFQVIKFNKVEDFWLQISTDAGATYETVKTYTRNVEFTNGTVYNDETVVITPLSGLTDQTRIRFRCDASNNQDDLYLDDIRISAQ
ncbi:MAG: ThuA domain-containing protein [Verrucomicrobiota bacterium]